jgi:hypothetical protein
MNVPGLAQRGIVLTDPMTAQEIEGYRVTSAGNLLAAERIPVEAPCLLDVSSLKDDVKRRCEHCGVGLSGNAQE